MRHLITLLFLSLVVVGCGLRQVDLPSPKDGRTEIRVINDNWNDADVYLLVEGARAPDRLGQVSGLSSRTFRVKNYRLQGFVRVVLQTFAENQIFVTNGIESFPPLPLLVQIRSSLRLSHLTMWTR